MSPVWLSVGTRCALIGILLVAIGAACSSPLGRREGAPAATASPRESRAPALDHLTPRRDSVGDMPMRFAWTPVQGAEFYTVGIWNDVETLVWRATNVRDASFDWTETTRLDQGTYFWSITAFREGQPIAESGRAAFVVK